MKRTAHASKTEQEEINREREYWKALADAVGWKVYGWSYMGQNGTCTYVTDSDPAMLRSPRTHLQLTGPQRDAIMAAIEKGKKQ